MKDILEAEEQILTQEEVGIYQNNATICVSFSATFTAATTFFTGLIISQYKTLDPSVNIPTLLLIISTFGFMYATLVYSNIGGFIYRKQIRRAKRCIVLGTVLSEYFGVYFLILAIPLIINIISHDRFLHLATTILDMWGLCIYHFSGFSIMERYYKRYHVLYLFIIIAFELSLVYFQFTNTLFLEIIASFLILFMAILAFLSRKEVI